MKPMVNQSKRIAAQRSVPFENQVQLVFFDIHKPNTAIYIIPQPSAMSEQDRRAKVEQEVQKQFFLMKTAMLYPRLLQNIRFISPKTVMQNKTLLTGKMLCWIL